MAAPLKAGRKRQPMVFSSLFSSLSHHQPPPPPPPRRLRPAALRTTPRTCPLCCDRSTRSILAWSVCFRHPKCCLPRWGVVLHGRGGGVNASGRSEGGASREQAAALLCHPHGRSAHQIHSSCLLTFVGTHPNQCGDAKELLDPAPHDLDDGGVAFRCPRPLSPASC